jgi:hypothetical protein
MEFFSYQLSLLYVTYKIFGWVPVAHIYNLSNSGGREQENCGLKPAQGNSLQDLFLKKTLHKKRTGGVAQGVTLEFKPQ